MLNLRFLLGFVLLSAVILTHLPCCVVLLRTGRCFVLPRDEAGCDFQHLVPPALSPSKAEVWAGITMKLGRGMVDFLVSMMSKVGHEQLNLVYVAGGRVCVCSGASSGDQTLV